jgi:hypothetical protein
MEYFGELYWKHERTQPLTNVNEMIRTLIYNCHIL